MEAGQSAQAMISPRYRCDCGGVLDVEMGFKLPKQHGASSQNGEDLLFDLDSNADNAPSAGADWRQLFDERVSGPPIWSISTDRLLLDCSGVWRYRELILPVPEEYLISRPEGYTGLSPVGIEHGGSGRA